MWITVPYFSNFVNILRVFINIFHVDKIRLYDKNSSQLYEELQIYLLTLHKSFSWGG